MMKLELCTASIEAVQLAKKHVFSRIELCQNLEQGGMTPSSGLIEYALACGVETHVLIRPRPGGFNYNDEEIEVILRDICKCKKIGVQGVVVGVLDERGLIHEDAMRMIRKHASGIKLTFHRAFDDTCDYKKSLDTIINLGVDRVLSSGLARNVDIGANVLKEMKEYAGSRIEIMLGGGVNASNIAQLVTNVNPDAIHFSATKKQIIDEGSTFSETILRVDEDKVKTLLNALN